MTAAASAAGAGSGLAAFDVLLQVALAIQSWKTSKTDGQDCDVLRRQDRTAAPDLLMSRDGRSITVELERNSNPDVVPAMFTDHGAEHCRSRWHLLMVPASRATELARGVGTLEEMGSALQLLREEAGLSLNQLAAAVEPLKIAGLGRSTIGRVCAGGSLCATREALVALVKACEVAGDDVEIWVGAWERARASQRRRGRHPVRTALSAGETPGDSGAVVAAPRDSAEARAEVVGMSGSVNGDVRDSAEAEEGLGAVDEDEGEDEVIGTWTVQLTRRHLRSAIMLSAVAGMAASTSSAAGVRNAAAVVLGVAATLAMVEMIRDNTFTIPAATAA